MAAQRVRSLLMRSDVPVALSRATHLLSPAQAGSLPPILGAQARHLTAWNRSAGLGGARAAPNGLPTVPCGGGGTTPGSKTTSMFHARRTKAWLRGENSK
jgi:hypothetical protein